MQLDVCSCTFFVQTLNAAAAPIENDLLANAKTGHLEWGITLYCPTESYQQQAFFQDFQLRRCN
jgi:hypothetical protein